MIAGLGAGRGVWGEEAFRTGLLEVLEEVGRRAKKEYLYDAEGYVYGLPSEVEIDVVTLKHLNRTEKETPHYNTKFFRS